MLIQALCAYYDALAASGNKLPDLPYSEQKIHYCVSLTVDGKIDAIQVFGEENSKGEIISRSTDLPYQQTFPGTQAKILDFRAKYVFGLQSKAKSDSLILETNGAHQDYVRQNLDFIAGLHSPVIDAFRAFLQNWNPSEETKNPFLLTLKKNFDKQYFVFCLYGRPDLMLHKDELLRTRWAENFRQRNEDIATDCDDKIAQCAVTGEFGQRIARTHDRISLSGVKQGGTALISCNTDIKSGESYGNTQAFNNDISKIAMRKYTVALNALLKDPNHHQNLNGITIVYWASGGEENQVTAKLLSALCFGNTATLSTADIDASLHAVLQHLKQGTVLPQQLDIFEGIDPNVTFYIVGLSPAVGKGRICLKFLYRQSFGKTVYNIAQFQSDLQIGDSVHAIPLKKLKLALLYDENANPNEKESAESSETLSRRDAAFFDMLFKIILSGGCFPNYIAATAVQKAKSARDVSHLQAAILKAYTNQKSRFANQKEELLMSLDKENKTPAYLCGRLFAVLEKLQRNSTEVSGGITETSFASAASRPAFVFPQLLKLAKVYLKNLSSTNKASAGYYDKCIREIMDKLQGEFPNALSIPEQGKFMVGYYQQKNDRNPKTETEENTEEIENGDQ